MMLYGLLLIRWWMVYKCVYANNSIHSGVHIYSYVCVDVPCISYLASSPSWTLCMFISSMRQGGRRSSVRLFLDRRTIPTFCEIISCSTIRTIHLKSVRTGLPSLYGNTPLIVYRALGSALPTHPRGLRQRFGSYALRTMMATIFTILFDTRYTPYNACKVLSALKVARKTCIHTYIHKYIELYVGIQTEVVVLHQLIQWASRLRYICYADGRRWYSWYYSLLPIYLQLVYRTRRGYVKGQGLGQVGG